MRQIPSAWNPPAHMPVFLFYFVSFFFTQIKRRMHVFTDFFSSPPSKIHPFSFSFHFQLFALCLFLSIFLRVSQHTHNQVRRIPNLGTFIISFVVVATGVQFFISDAASRRPGINYTRPRGGCPLAVEPRPRFLRPSPPTLAEQVRGAMGQSTSPSFSPSWPENIYVF